MKKLEKISSQLRSLFFSSVAHELRTPLNSIIPLSQRLNKYITDDKGKEILQIIQNSSIHLQNVIEDALDMSRIENNKFSINYSKIDLRATIKEVIDIMEF